MDRIFNELLNLRDNKALNFDFELERRNSQDNKQILAPNNGLNNRTYAAGGNFL